MIDVAEQDVVVAGGRVLCAYDSGPAGERSGLTVTWHHGSPQTGRLPDPLRAAAAERGIRLLSYGRPSYGGSTPQPGRTVGDAAADTVAVLDAFGVDRAAAVGASGGGPHALAGAARLPDRVTAVVALAGPAPRTDDFDWAAGQNGLRVGAQGRAARAAYAETAEFDASSFTAADYALSRAAGPGWVRTQAAAAGRARTGWSTTTWPWPSHGASTSTGSRSRCCWSTVARTG